MNVILPVPHIVVCDAEIETDGVTEAFTVMVMPLLVAVVEVGHAALEVNTHVIISPLANVEELYVELLVPTFDPFFFHW